MEQLKMKQYANFKWSIAVLIAIASVITLASKSSQAQRESSSGKLVQTAAGTEAATQVLIDDYVFNPAAITVKVGTTVTWINHDDDAHTVDSSQGKFKSKVLNKDDKFEFHVSEAGEYPFVCRFHPKMTGKIIAQP